jgi:hypothetical protein
VISHFIPSTSLQHMHHLHTVNALHTALYTVNISHFIPSTSLQHMHRLT